MKMSRITKISSKCTQEHQNIIKKCNGNVDQATNHNIRVGGMSRKALKSAAVARATGTAYRATSRITFTRITYYVVILY